MNKSLASLKKNDSVEGLMNHPAIEWTISHKKMILWIFLGFLAALIFTYRLVSIRSLNSERDYYQAEKIFNEFQKIAAPPTDLSLVFSEFEQLNAILKRHAELKPKYDGPLAQTFLVLNKVPEAEMVANDIFKRTPPDLQFYQKYSQGSLLIAGGNFTEALQLAAGLKTALDNVEAKGNSFLYLFTLIRLATLHQQLGNQEEELKIWNEFQNQSNSEAFKAVNLAFSLGQASFEQYIEERKKNLTAK